MKEASNKIVEKIQKLLALGQSPNEAEAMAAMQKAQELLALHDLAMGDVEGRTDEPDEAVTQMPLEGGLKSCPTWQQWIISALAKNNHCEVYVTGAGFRIIGKPHRIQIVSSFFSYLMDTMGRERRKALKIAKADPNSEANRYSNYSWNMWRTDFDKGMATRIHARLIEQGAALQEQAVEQMGSALAVQNREALAKQEINDWKRANGLRLSPPSSRTIYSRHTSARDAGVNAGNRTGLGSQLGAGSTGSRMALPGR